MKERILLHLIEYTKYVDEVEVPSAITQEGIARETGIDVPHFTQYVRPLIQEGLVRERTAHVKGVRRRRKVYDLTDTGKLSGVRLRDKLKSEVLRVRDQKEVREASVSQILKEMSSKVSVLDVFRQVMETGIVDLASLVPASRVSFVEMLSGAPQIDVFVGRRAEVDEVTEESDGPRIFVIRGVAGIGKSSLAAKACELLKGRRNLFWHRVRPWDTQQSMLADLGDFLSALDRPGLRLAVGKGEAHRAAQILRADLPGTRSFLVFDDAHEATREALPFFQLFKEAIADASDARALVLTRRRLPFYNQRDLVLGGLLQEIDLPGLQPAEVRALAASDREVESLLRLSLRLRGHPLSLKLARSVSPAATPTLSLRSAHAFLEQEIYEELSDSHRKMMKVASLYRVPVPREALFADRSLSYDVLLELANRSLLRAAGEDRFEVHDTIRDFFSTLLTPSERNELGAFAAKQLRGLASQATEVGNLVLAIDYLSNALQVSGLAEEQVALWEALGDANEQIGDLPGCLTAYKEGVRATRDREVIVRFHRKMASALLTRGEIGSASQEIEAGFRSLGEAFHVERGWLDLLRSRVAQSAAWEESREHGLAALQAFRTFGNLRGQGEALMRLGNVELHSPTGNRALAKDYLLTALGLSEALGEPKFAWMVHSALTHMYAYHLPDAERALHHVAALENVSGAMDNPQIRISLLLEKGMLNVYLLGDQKAADSQLNEAMALARKVHDPGALVEARYTLADATFFQGRPAEARAEFEQVSADSESLGNVFYQLRALWRMAECSLLLGDLESFLGVVAAFEDTKLSEAALGKGFDALPVPIRVARGIALLFKGDREGSLDALEEALRIADQLSTVQEAPLQSDAYAGPFYYGLALRAFGEPEKASKFLDRTAEIFRSYGMKSHLGVMPDHERRLTEVLRRASKTS